MEKNSKKLSSKKRLRKLTSMLLALTLIFSVTTVAPFTVSAAETSCESVGVTSGDFEYKLLEDETAEITGYSGTATQLTIPSSIDGYTVTSIGELAFSFTESLTSVTIPDSVTEINGYAFSYCSTLASVIMGNNVTSIGVGAFDYCTSLASVIIGNSVTSIGEGAFDYCTNLKDVYYSEGKGAWNDIYIAYENDCLENAVIHFNSKGPLPVETSGDFEYALLWDKTAEITGYTGTATQLTIPSSIDSYTVTSIGEYAFSDCTSLSSVTIGNSVTKIGVYAFGGCTSLTSIIIGNSVTEIGGSAFSGCTSLASVIIGNSVTSIDNFAFSGCTSLASVTIPDSVREIGWSAFSNCDSLASITIPESVTSIDEAAFLGCTSLKAITVPDSVDTIGYEALGYSIYYDDITDDYIFDPLDGFTIYGYSGSAAETYANENKFTFVDLDNKSYSHADETSGIRVVAKADADLSVTKTTDEQTINNIKLLTEDKGSVLDVYDISLKKDGKAVQHEGMAEVTIPCNNKNVKVYRVEADNTLTDMNAVYEDGNLHFYTEHFSLYALVTPKSEGSAVIGDVNGDGNITILDATAIQKHLARLEVLTDEQLAVADTNGDGNVTILDATEIQKYLAKLVPSLG